MVKRYFPDLKTVGTGIAAVMSEDDGKFPAAWVQGSDYDALAAELAEANAALDRYAQNPPWDRVPQLEAALRKMHDAYHSKHCGCQVVVSLLTVPETPSCICKESDGFTDHSPGCKAADDVPQAETKGDANASSDS